MKKFLALLLAVMLVVSLTGCKGNSSDDGGNVSNENSALNEAVSNGITTDPDTGAISMDENVVKELLSVYSADALGLSEDVYDYAFKLSQATLNGEACCEAKAFLIDPVKPEGIFYIVGTKCYRYDEAENKYYLLTSEGAQAADVEIEAAKSEVSTTEGTTVKQRTEEDIDDENTKVLRDRYSNYDLSVVGLPKPITEYEFKATGKTGTAEDGTPVYVIYLMEDGQYTEFTFAIGTNGKDYYYDSVADEYKVLS